MSHNAAALIQLSRYSYSHQSEHRTNVLAGIIKAVKPIWAEIQSKLCTQRKNTPIATVQQLKLTLSSISNNQSELLSTEEIQDILKYIRNNSPKKPTVIRTRESFLPRTLFYDGKKWYLLLTKYRNENDPLLGYGYFKKIKYAIDLSSGEKRALATINRLSDDTPLDTVKKEIQLYEETKDLPEVVHLHASIYKKKSKEEARTKFDKTYLIFDLCDRGDLFGLIKKRSLTIEEASSLALDCAKGVAALHKKGILHRDLKPENIFLCTGENNQLKGVCCITPSRRIPYRNPKGWGSGGFSRLPSQAA